MLLQEIRTGLGRALVISGLSIPVPSFAQADGAGLEEITVTARRVTEDLQKVPIALSVYSGRELDARGALDLADIGSAGPNVQIERQGNISGLSSAPSVFVRGIGQSDFIIVADPAVGIYLDGVYIGRTIGGLFDLVDVERVEIMRGPQGTLFGRNSIGGAINVVSRDASPDHFQAEATFNAGEYSYRELSGSVNIPIGDRSALRLTGLVRHRDGYVDASHYEDLKLGDDNVSVLRAKLQLQPAESLSIGISADFSLEREAPAAQVFPLIGTVGVTTVNSSQYRYSDITVFNNGGTFDGGRAPLAGVEGQSSDPRCAVQNADLNLAAPDDPDCAGPYYQSTLVSHARWLDRYGRFVEPDNEVAVSGVSVNIAWVLDNGAVRSITAHREFESAFTNDMDGTPFIIFQNINDPFDQEQFSEELQYVRSFAEDRIDLTAGLYHFEESGVESIAVYRSNAYVNSLATIGPPIIPQTPAGSRLPDPPFQFDNSRYIRNTSDALYAQATWHVGRRLHFTGGMRYTTSRKAFDLVLDFAENVATEKAHGLSEMEERSPLFTIGYDISDDLFAYAGYSTGFREGGFPARFAGGSLPEPLPSFEPEFVGAYEVGLKSTLLDDRLRINAAWFLSRYEDIQVAGIPPNLPPGALLSTVINAGDTDIEGIELEVSALLRDNFRIDANVAVLDNEFDCISAFDATGRISGCSQANALIVGGQTVTTANSLPRSPELMMNLGVSYRVTRIKSGSIAIRADWRYVDERYFDLGNVTSDGAYDVLDASVAYTSPDGRWSATLGARNVTDEFYSLGNAIQELGNTTMLPARPRNLYGKFQMKFGR